MALTYDTKAQKVAATNPVVLSYTCGANAKVLVVGLVVNSLFIRSEDDPTVTYNGVAMTAVSRQAAATEVTAELWYLINPLTGAAYNISIPNDNSSNIRVIASSYISSGDVSLDVSSAEKGTTANPSRSVTTTVDGDAIVDIMASSLDTAETGNNRTLLYSNDEGNWNSASQYALQATLGAITFTHTIAAANWGHIVAAFKETITAVTTFIPWIGEDLPH